MIFEVEDIVKNGRKNKRSKRRFRRKYKGMLKHLKKDNYNELISPAKRTNGFEAYIRSSEPKYAESIQKSPDIIHNISILNSPNSSKIRRKEFKNFKDEPGGAKKLIKDETANQIKRYFNNVEDFVSPGIKKLQMQQKFENENSKISKM